MSLLTPYLGRRNLPNNIFDEMSRFFDDMSKRPFFDDLLRYSPASDVTEEENAYKLSIDLPGMKIEDIKIEVHDSTLTVSGERRDKFTAKDKNKTERHERTYGSFTRSYTLPSMIDGDKIEASYEDGVLEVSVPKSKTARSRTVEIKAGRGMSADRLGTSTASGEKSEFQSIKDSSQEHKRPRTQVS